MKNDLKSHFWINSCHWLAVKELLNRGCLLSTILPNLTEVCCNVLVYKKLDTTNKNVWYIWVVCKNMVFPNVFFFPIIINTRLQVLCWYNIWFYYLNYWIIINNSFHFLLEIRHELHHLIFNLTVLLNWKDEGCG